MRCLICRRPLLHCAVPGLAIGPTCAKQRGLAPEPAQRRPRLFDLRRTTPDPAQVDWVAQLSAAHSDGVLPSMPRGG